jgi:hypothetical protein
MKKRTVNLLTFLMMLSLCSVGFSSWIIAPGNEDFTIDENIVTDPAIDASSFVPVSSIKHFSYSDRGFVNSADQKVASSTGTIIVNYTIKLDMFNDIYPDEESLKFKIVLKYADSINHKNFNIFTTDENRSFTHTVNSSENITSISSSTPTQDEIKASYEYVTYVSFSNLLKEYRTNPSEEDYTFTITYNVSILNETGDYFLNNIYPKIAAMDGTFGFGIKTSFVSFNEMEVDA